MKTTTYLASDLPGLNRSGQAAPLAVQTSPTFCPIDPKGLTQKEELRHILLGSPGAIRQTIYLLHSLHYAESGLWSPVMAVGDRLILTPDQGEAMSLLRRSL
ncbi:MAG: hypothetical protein WBD47_00305 [Phormidesmis sp.]